MEVSTDSDWLSRWYMQQCDGHWEHEYGITIESLDNPGWSLTVDLAGTPLEGREFKPFEDKHRFPLDWMGCKVEGSQFVGHGGPSNLTGLLATFRKWASGE